MELIVLLPCLSLPGFLHHKQWRRKILFCMLWLSVGAMHSSILTHAKEGIFTFLLHSLDNVACFFSYHCHEFCRTLSFPEASWPPADCFPSSRKHSEQWGRACFTTPVVPALASIQNFTCIRPSLGSVKPHHTYVNGRIAAQITLVYYKSVQVCHCRNLPAHAVGDTTCSCTYAVVYTVTTMQRWSCIRGTVS